MWSKPTHTHTRTYTHTQRHTDIRTLTNTNFLARTGRSQKFKLPAGLILIPSAWTSEDVWASSICLHSALTGVLGVALSANCLGCRKEREKKRKRKKKTLGHECFIWAGQITGSDMASRQEDCEVSSLDLREPDKPSCPVQNAGLSTFLGDPCITWLAGSRCYVCREDMFNLWDWSFDGPLWVGRGSGRRGTGHFVGPPDR